MTYFSLCFSSQSGLALERTILLSPVLGEIRAVRGKTSGAFSNCSSFQWTPAVKALALLVLQSVMDRRLGKSAHYVMSGGRGSPASSLDYAISKRNNWVLDMFGVDSLGNSLVQRYIRRSNSHRKHGEVVSISLNQHKLELDQIRILVDDREVTNGEALSELIGLIEATWHDTESTGNRKARPAGIPRSSCKTAVPEAAPPKQDGAGLLEIRELIQREVESRLNELLPFLGAHSSQAAPRSVSAAARA